MSGGNNAHNHSVQELRILKYFADGLKENEQFDCLKKSGYLDILSKCAVGANASFDNFLADIDRVAKKQNYRKGSKQHKAVGALEEYWRGEMIEIGKCVDCYESFITSEENPDYFTLLCTKPHLLVFIREPQKEGSRMWPAKVLSVDNDKNKATIECFGDHLRAGYKFDQCILYTDAQETARKKLNLKYAKNTKIGHQEEYQSSFTEVEKYIENVKAKFGSFVPAVTKRTISHVDQHLIDMYPGAFTQVSVKNDTVEQQATPAEVANNRAKPSTSNRGNNSTATRIISPISSGYMSQHTSVHDSDFDDHDDSVDQNPSERIELDDIKIEHVVENNSQFDTEANDESRVGNGGSITDEDELNGLNREMESIHSENRKRKADNIGNSIHRWAMKRSRSSRLGHPPQTNDDVITIEDEDPDDTESMSTTSQNPNDRTMNGGHSGQLLREYGQANELIGKYQERLGELKKQKNFIRLEMDTNKANFDEMLDQHDQIAVKISKCDDKLVRLNAQKDIIWAKLNN